MASVTFNPNTWDSSADIGGASGGGDDPHGKEYYMRIVRTNYYQQGSSLPPIYQIQYGSGWAPLTAECRGTFTADNYARIAGVVHGDFVDGLNVDGSKRWQIEISEVSGIKKGSTGIENVQFGKWNGTLTVTRKNSDGTETTTTENTTNMRIPFGPQLGAALEIAPRCIGSIDSNIPLFLSQAAAHEYLRTGTMDGMINVDEPEEPNDYEFYIYNQITSTLGAGLNYEYYYRYAMQDGGRLAFYKHEMSGYPQYDRTLIGIEGIEQIYKGDSASQEVFPVASSTVLNFLGAQKKMQSGTTWTPVMYQTNIPTFDTLEHARNYIDTGDETGIIDKWRSDGIIDGEIGEPTDETENGENGALFSFGGGMYRMTSAKMAAFYSEVFNSDPSVMESILEGLQLFGANQINAIHDVMYVPFSVDDVATLSANNDIYLGSYKMTVTGDRVLKNNKMINMGTHFFAAPYGPGDHRNYAPLCRIFIMLPYAGTHELQIDKYINKNVTIKLAVDLTSGLGTYFIYGNSTCFDSFDCQIGAHRPITAVDHAQHVASVTNAVMQTGAAGVKTVAGATSVINPAKAATSTHEATNTSINAGALGGVVGGAIDTVNSGYNAMQDSIDYPMTERGSFSGFVGMFDIKRPYFVFAQMQTKQPANLLRVKGKPSSAGGKLSSFFGYFEAVAVDLPTFAGTDAEAEELINILKGGIYID